MHRQGECRNILEVSKHHMVQGPTGAVRDGEERTHYEDEEDGTGDGGGV